jgi:hypothetical protein
MVHVEIKSLVKCDDLFISRVRTGAGETLLHQKCQSLFNLLPSIYRVKVIKLTLEYAMKNQKGK